MKRRISNLLAWFGFSIAPTAALLFIAFVAHAYHELIAGDSFPPDDCSNCYVLTYEDIRSSYTLQSLNARVGDWVIGKNGNTLERRKPIWVTNTRDFTDGYLTIYDGGLLYRGIDLHILHWLLWVMCSSINYILIGTPRVLPWRPIEDNN